MYMALCRFLLMCWNLGYWVEKTQPNTCIPPVLGTILGHNCFFFWVYGTRKINRYNLSYIPYTLLFHCSTSGLLINKSIWLLLETWKLNLLLPTILWQEWHCHKLTQGKFCTLSLPVFIQVLVLVINTTMNSNYS